MRVRSRAGVPFNVLVDNSKQLVYITEQKDAAIHVFNFAGDYFGHFKGKRKFLSWLLMAQHHRD